MRVRGSVRCSWHITIWTGGLFMLAGSGPELARPNSAGYGVIVSQAVV